MAKVERKAAVMERPEIPATDLNDLPLACIEDFKVYNKEARRQGRPVRIPPNEMHKQVKIKFQRFDQPENVLKTWVRNAEVDWRGQLIPNRVYTLAAPVVKFLNSRAVPVYGEVEVKDGSDTKIETKQIGERARFSCQVVDFD